MRALIGVAAAPGIAVGNVRHLSAAACCSKDGRLALTERAGAVKDAIRALDVAAVQLETIAADLRLRDRATEADIVETGALMARDPSLNDAVATAILDSGLPAPDAIIAAADSFAQTLAALDDPMLAARAADVHSLGRRAARIAAGRPGPASRGDGDAAEDIILAADDLGPGDVAELDADIRAIALAHGGVTGHAAIVARSLGLPVVVGLGDPLFGIPEGASVVVDGEAGTLTVEPSLHSAAAARAAAAERRRRLDADATTRDLSAVTADGHRVRMLANVSGGAELALALDAGAEGVGLLRTELAFLEWVAWPTAPEHCSALEPLLGRLAGRPATVRILDFGGDKLPPFLEGRQGRGIQLFREAPQALSDQLEAILTSGSTTELRILIPMVIEPDDVRLVADAITAIRRRLPHLRRPLLGAMIEVPAAVTMVRSLARCVDFLSIGTNDLTHFQLGLDRATAASAPAHHPAVLRLVSETVDAAHEAGIVVDVCGESASNRVAMPLLVGLGVDELSVGAARVGEVRRWVRSLNRQRCIEAARRAVRAESLAEVEEISAALGVSLEMG
jgi:phosphoenolpyruvate-protein kinase (PTS system EI component)